MSEEATSVPSIEGQLSAAERELLTRAVSQASRKPRVAIEVGTWLGGGSTLHILRALESNGEGHLWGVEADAGIYERMIANIRAAAPKASARFTPLFGRSDDVLPGWITKQGADLQVDFVFLDGGDNPLEQILEFKLLDPFIPIGGQLLSHDARMRKGKWLVPFLSRLDNWKCEVIDASEMGLLRAIKQAPEPTPKSLRAARAHLRWLRLQPVELVGALLPRQVCSFAVKRLPMGIFRRLYRGSR